MKYDAFISYRHGGVDQFVAERLHKKLEAFKLPKRLLEKGNGKKRITRVFRDQDELPLSSNLEDSIKDALRESEWLIVICTPRLKDSVWCMKEIETFGEMHGKDHILAVLVEGEPNDSFPEQLRTKEVKKFDATTGQTITITERVEPLAADVRAENNSKIKKAMETEILRLLAPMFGVDYDDLKMRQRARRVRRIAILATIVVTLSMGFAIYTSIMNLRISKQKDEIQQQNIKIEAQNADILEKNDKIEEQMKDLLYNQAKANANESLRYNDNNMKLQAIKIAYDSLTDTSEYPLPRTSYCELALSEALDIYHYDRVLRAVDIIEIGKPIYTFDASSDFSYVLVICSDKTVVLYDYNTRKPIWEIETDISNLDAESTARAFFISNTEFAIIGDDDISRIYSIDSGNVKEELTLDIGFEVYSMTNTLHNKYSIYNGINCSCVVDNSIKKVIYSNHETLDISISNDGRFIAAYNDGQINIYSTEDTENAIAIIDPEDSIASDYDISGLTVCSDPDNEAYCYVTYTNTDPSDIFNIKTYAYKVDIEAANKVEVVEVKTPVETEEVNEGEEASEPTEMPTPTEEPKPDKTKGVVWCERVEGLKLNAIRFNTEDYHGLLLYSKFHLYLIDADNGEILAQYENNNTNDFIEDVMVFDNFFRMVLADGNIISYYNGMGFTVTLEKVDLKSAEIKAIKHFSSDYGILLPAVTTGNSGIVVFSYNPPTRLNEVVIDSYQSCAKECENYRNVEASAKANELKITDANLTNSMVYIEEEDLAILIFNSSLRVVKVSTNEVLYETTYITNDIVFTRGLYNIDEDNNLYVLVNDGALVFNSDRELIANAKGVIDFEYGTNNMVFASVYSSSMVYVGGLVSLEDMLHIAEIKMR